MIYVWDNNAFSVLFSYYYRKRFPSLWDRFDPMVASGGITSTREVRREIPNHLEEYVDWSKSHAEIFTTPTRDEALVVRDIYAVAHFQQNIERKKLLNGGNNADPFLIAKAKVVEGIVVTREKKDLPNAVRIPNICGHFGVGCMSLEEFMEEEGWEF